MLYKLLTIDDVKSLFNIGKEWVIETGNYVSDSAVMEEAIGCINDAITFGAFDTNKNDKLIGFIVLQKQKLFWFDKMVLVENMMFVSKDYRDIGVGSKLLEFVDSLALNSKYSHVFMFPNKFGSSSPEKAKSVMEKNGYVFHGYIMRKDF